MASKTYYRNKEDGMLTGVSAGLADYFGADVTLIRILVAAFIFVTGFFPGFFVYLVAAVVAPVKPASKSAKSETKESK